MALEAMSAAPAPRTISINMDLCKGCGICASLCPKKVLGMTGGGKVTVLNQALCTGCRNCENHCPDFAIFAKVD